MTFWLEWSTELSKKNLSLFTVCSILFIILFIWRSPHNFILHSMVWQYDITVHIMYSGLDGNMSTCKALWLPLQSTASVPHCAHHCCHTAPPSPPSGNTFRCVVGTTTQLLDSSCAAPGLLSPHRGCESAVGGEYSLSGCAPVCSPSVLLPPWPRFLLSTTPWNLMTVSQSRRSNGSHRCVPPCPLIHGSWKRTHLEHTMWLGTWAWSKDTKKASLLLSACPRRVSPGIDCWDRLLKE